MTDSVGIDVRVLRDDEHAEYGPQIAAIESAVDYPLGTDRFHIDHGADYFGFFRRLGRLRYVVAERDGQLVAMLAAVERALSDGPAWYLGDLKLAPGGEGLALSRRLLEEVRHQAGPVRAYGISMNPGDGSANRVVRLLSRLAPDLTLGETLNLYSLDANEMLDLAQVLAEHRGPLQYLSLTGTKDIVLASSGAAMPLLHVQFGPCAEAGHGAPIPGGVHMFCTPAGDALDAAVRNREFKPTATASILHVDMAGVDWSFVLTSDI
jgi:hypothetical protein